MDFILQGMKVLDDTTKSRFVGSLAMGAELKGSPKRLQALDAFVRNLTVDDFLSPLLRAVIPCYSQNTTNLGKARVGPSSDCWWSGKNIFVSPGDFIDQYTLVAFEAVSLVLHTVNHLLVEGKDPATIEKHDLMLALHNTSFEGLTGRVMLDGKGDRIPGRFLLQSVSGTEDFLAVASYDPISEQVKWLDEVRFADGTADLPPDAFPKCPVGRFRDYTQVTSNECSLCPEGKYAPVEGATSCLDCAPGSYSVTQGASVCKPCGLGQFQNMASSGNCTACPAGTSQNVPGSRECQAGYLKAVWRDVSGAATLP